MPNAQDARQQAPGAFSAILTNFNGQEVRDLRPLVLECNLYEDIFAPGITADMALADAQALQTEFPIIGGETLQLDWASAGRDQPHMMPLLRNYKLDNKTAVQDRTDVYTLHFGSAPFVLDQTRTVTSASQTQPADATVRDLYAAYFKPLKAGPLLAVESCGPLPAMAFPRYSPLRAMAYLAEEAASLADPASPLLWYESHLGWAFSSLRTLSLQEPVETYYFFPANMQENPGAENKLPNNQIPRRNQLIISFQQHRSFDLLRALANGQYGMDLQYVDLVLKTYGVQSYKYRTDFKTQGHVGTDPSFPSLPDTSLFNDTNASHSRYHITRLNRAASNYARLREGLAGPVTPGRGRTQFGAQRTAALFQLQNTTTFLVAVPGYSKLAAGQVVRLVLPEMSGGSKANQKESRLTSGLYLITSLVHRYSSGEYYTVMECMRDNYPQPIKHIPSPAQGPNPSPTGAV